MKQAAKLGFLAFLLLVVFSPIKAQIFGPPTHPEPVVPVPLAKTPTFKVNVQMVLVEVGVHDEHGRAVGNLNQDDFRVFEDGKEQKISAFSHQELPLAVALVVDNSSSIAAALDELRRGALDTLRLLKRDDQVAIFSFGEHPELVEGLTNDHYELSVDLWALSPYGGTDIDGALHDSALYLGHNAGNSRRAVILVSDNEPSEEQTSDVPQVVRAAEQSGTPIYSIKVGYLPHSRSFFMSHSEARTHDVEKICKQTGGEMIDTSTGVSVTSAMQTILNWLKQGYTIGYYPTNTRQDGSFRSIEVRLDQPPGTRAHKYVIYARQGYYASAGRSDDGKD